MKKNQLTKKEILHLAKLSNLGLSDKEVEKYRSQLAETVDYINNLNQLDTENVKPTNQTTNLTNVFFEDGQKNTRCLTKKQALANAKRKRGNLFVIRRIL